MKRAMITRSLLAAVGLALALATLQAQAQPGNTAPRGNCYLNQILPGSGAPPAQGLSEAEKSALNEAIQDEYKSRATYNAILDTFGEIRPFANIVNAEGRHVEALAYLHTRYGVAIPDDTWAEKVPDYATLKEAAEAAVQAEVDNGALYDRLLENVSNEELTNVFSALQFATMEHHLPAFKRLVAVESGQFNNAGRGPGMGRGRGAGCGCCCIQGAPVGRGAGAGMGMGRGGRAMRGAGTCWNAGNGPGRGQGLGANQGYGPGRGQGLGANQGYGRGAGRGFNPPPNCPRYN